jgi:hypothetical protein
MVYLCCLLITAGLASGTLAQTLRSDVPRAWNDHEVTGFELPLVNPERSPRYLSAAEYYSLEVMPIYRGYPVYLPEENRPAI